MGALDLQYETEPAGPELSLSKGVGPWLDDLVAAGVLVLIVSVLTSRAYRWARAQADHPRQLVENVVAQAKGAGSAAVQGWRGSQGPEDGGASASDLPDAQEHVSVGTPPGV